MTESAAILVLGMHRSGTSAVTRVLNLMGVHLGSSLKGAAQDNPKGFWEHNEVVTIHEALLAALGMSWDDPRRLPDGWIELPAAREAVASIVQLVEREFRPVNLWAVKDPRLCRFVPLWKEALGRLHMQPRVLLVTRDPREVAESLRARNDIPESVAELLWARYMEDAATGSNGLERSVLDYQALLDDWRGAMAGVARDLDLTLDASPEASAAIDDFLSIGLRHHRHSVEPIRGFVAGMVQALNIGRTDVETGFAALADAVRAMEREMQPLQQVIDGMAQMLAARGARLAKAEAEGASIAQALEQSTAWGSSRDAELRETIERAAKLESELANSTAWGASRDVELAATVEHAHALEAELLRSTEWGASRDIELRKAITALGEIRQERDSLQQELQHQQEAMRQLEKLMEQEISQLKADLARLARERQNDADSAEQALRRKQQEVDGLQHQANLLFTRVSALEHALYVAGPWNATRRTVGAAYRWSRRALKASLIGAIQAWPGSPARKHARRALLTSLNEARISGANGWAIQADVAQLGERRWPARPAFLLRARANTDVVPVEIDLSVVVHHSERWVEGFLASVQSLDYPLEHVHLHVRDHGGDSATREAFDRCLAQGDFGFGSYHYSAGRNAGYGAGHNHNFRQGKAAYFLVCNIDGRFRADSLRQLVSAVTTSDPSVAAWELRQAPYEHPKYYDPVTMLTSWVSGACVMFRRDAYDAVRGFDDRIFMYGEDVDLSYRLRGRGYGLAYVPTAVFEHDSYSEPEQFKPLQFHGSSLANILLRLRFGNFADLLPIPGMWRELGRSARAQGAYGGYLRNTLRLLRRAPGFLATRYRRGSVHVPFLRWDYGLRRMGAFEPAETPGGAPLVSVVVRTYRGRGELLRQALASVANQTYGAVEVIVVEDKGCQLRDTAEACARDFGLNVRYLCNDSPDSNRCVTGNLGLEAAHGEYACFLDDDDLLFADHLEYLVSRLDARPELGAAYSLAWETKVIVDPQNGRYREVMHSSLPGQQLPFDRDRLQVSNFIPIQAVLFRRSLYVRCGGFDTTLEYLEDWNLWRRYSWKHDFAMFPKTTSLYHVPAEHARESDRQAKLDEYYHLASKASEMALQQMGSSMSGFLDGGQPGHA
jgi:GT2 family glycosyltransferase